MTSVTHRGSKKADVTAAENRRRSQGLGMGRQGTRHCWSKDPMFRPTGGTGPETVHQQETGVNRTVDFKRPAGVSMCYQKTTGNEAMATHCSHGGKRCPYATADSGDLSIKASIKPGMVAHTYDLNTGEVEAQGLPSWRPACDSEHSVFVN